MHIAYSRRSPTRLGFNGEYMEPHGVQLLGSYRAYNPASMRFHNKDSLSPFGKGGLNGYGYCLGDPVSHVDPTGHLALWTWAKSHPFHFAFYSSVVGIATFVASSIVSNESAKKALYGTSAVLFTTAIASVPFALARHRYIRVQQRRDAVRLHGTWRAGGGLQARQPSVVDDQFPTYETATRLNDVTPPASEPPSYNSLYPSGSLRINDVTPPASEPPSYNSLYPSGSLRIVHLSAYQRAMTRNQSSVRNSIRETAV